jgi:hypothetical protein
MGKPVCIKLNVIVNSHDANTLNHILIIIRSLPLFLTQLFPCLQPLVGVLLIRRRGKSMSLTFGVLLKGSWYRWASVCRYNVWRCWCQDSGIRGVLVVS